MIGLYWHFCKTIFFLLPESFFMPISVFKYRDLIEPLVESYALAVAELFTGHFVHSERCLFKQVKKTVISLT